MRRPTGVAVWSLIDQAGVAGANLLLILLTARIVDVDDFGQFALAMSFVAAALAANKAVTGSALLILPPAVSRSHDRAGATLQSLIGGMAMSGVMYAILLLTDQDWLLPLAWGVPGMLLLNIYKFVCVDTGQYGRAALVSTLALASMVALLVLAPGGNAVDPSGAWAVSRCLGGLLVLLLVPRHHPTRALRSFRHRTRALRPNLTRGFLAAQSAGIAAPWLSAAIGGVAVTAAIRGAQSLLSVVTLALAGLAPPATARAARSYQRADRPPLREVRQWAVLSSVLVVGVVATALLIPPSLGTQLLGATWLVAQPLLLPLGIALLFDQLLSSLLLGLRAMRSLTYVWRLRAVASALALSCLSIGVAGFGAVGGAAGLAVASALALMVAAAFSPRALLRREKRRELESRSPS